MLLQIALFHSFLLLNTPLYIFIHSSADSWSLTSNAILTAHLKMKTEANLKTYHGM